MPNINPTEYLTTWLQAAEDYIREDAIYRARLAVADPLDRVSYLNDLEALVSYTWNVQEWGVRL